MKDMEKQLGDLWVKVDFIETKSTSPLTWSRALKDSLNSICTLSVSGSNKNNNTVFSKLCN